MALTNEMIRDILKDGKVKGKEISEKQRTFFQDVLDGKRESGQPKEKDSLILLNTRIVMDMVIL